MERENRKKLITQVYFFFTSSLLPLSDVSPCARKEFGKKIEGEEEGKNRRRMRNHHLVLTGDNIGMEEQRCGKTEKEKERAAKKRRVPVGRKRSFGRSAVGLFEASSADRLLIKFEGRFSFLFLFRKPAKKKRETR